MTTEQAGFKSSSVWHRTVHSDDGVVRRAADVQCRQHFLFKRVGGQITLEKWSSKCQFGHVHRDYISVIWKLTPGVFYPWAVSGE